jgi:hypothetical protein
MIHNVSPTQKVQCQRGIIQDNIFFCNEGIEFVHHIVTCKTRDLDGKIIFLQEIQGALRLKGETHNELLSDIFMTGSSLFYAFRMQNGQFKLI